VVLCPPRSVSFGVVRCCPVPSGAVRWVRRNSMTANPSTVLSSGARNAGSVPPASAAGAYAVYTWAETGEGWTLVEVFASIEEADRHAASLIAERGQRNPKDYPSTYDHWHRSEAVVVAVANRADAEQTLPESTIVPIVSRYVHGAPPPGPALELTEDEEERRPPNREAGVP
jgi:hypothetical protein